MRLNDRGHQWQITLCWFLGAALTVFLYWPGLSGPFMLDDDSSVKPAHVQTLNLPDFLNATFANTSGPLGRPIAVATFILNDYFWGPDPYSYKVTNLAIHLLIGGFIFIWLRQLCRHKGLPDIFPLLISLLWMIHPIQLSTALYPVQRMAQLSSLFMILGCIGYTSARLRQLAEQSSHITRLFGSALLCFPLALLSKENGAILALYYLCLEVFIFQGQCQTKAQRTSLIVFLTLFNFLPILGAIGYIASHWDKYLGLYHTHLFTLSDRMLTQPVVLLFYLKELLIPQISQLGLFLDDFPIYTHLSPLPIFALCVHAGILSFLFYNPKQYPLIRFSIAWFYASHAIESSILPLEMVFEHRNYLASLGVFIPVVLLFSWKPLYASIRPIFIYACLAGYLFLLSALTFMRAETWGNMGLFLSIEVDEHPNSARAHVFWANYLSSHQLHEESLKHLIQAEKLSPHNLGPKVHQLLLYCRSPQLPAGLLEHVLHSATHDIITAYAVSTLDFLTNRELLGKCPAIPHETFLTLMTLTSENPHIQNQKEWLASLYTDRATAYMLLENYEEAIIWLNKAFNLYPKRISPLLTKADYQILTHHFQEAHETIESLKKRAPAHYIAWLESKLQEAKERHARSIQVPLKF